MSKGSQPTRSISSGELMKQQLGAGRRNRRRIGCQRRLGGAATRKEYFPDKIERRHSGSVRGDLRRRGEHTQAKSRPISVDTSPQHACVLTAPSSAVLRAAQRPALLRSPVG